MSLIGNDFAGMADANKDLVSGEYLTQLGAGALFTRLILISWLVVVLAFST